jgi:hypothetical protein
LASDFERCIFTPTNTELQQITSMAKIDKDFILIDESVVMNGFRVLMSGAELGGFIKNPVMLLMHLRAEKGMLDAADEDVLLPIGKWYDIRVEGDKLLAKPWFDDNDAFALKVESKVKGGFLNGASIWLEPIAVSDDENLKLAGQRGPTVTKWGVNESSIVDIPNCRNALAIKNAAGQKILLHSNTAADEAIQILNSFIDKKDNMDKKLLCANLGLADTATDAQITDALLALKNSADGTVQLSAQVKTLGDEVVRLKKEATEKSITDLVDGAIAGKKLLAGDRDKYVKLAAADFDTVKELIDGMKPYMSIESKLAAEGKTDVEKMELEGLMKLSGHDLYMDGKLDRLKELSLDGFKLKYKEALGVDFVYTSPLTPIQKRG